MTPREQLERMVVAGQKEIGASDPADEYFLRAALGELVEIRKIHPYTLSSSDIRGRIALAKDILAITELEL